MCRLQLFIFANTLARPQQQQMGRGWGSIKASKPWAMSATSKPPDGPGTRWLRFGFALGFWVMRERETERLREQEGMLVKGSAPFCCLVRGIVVVIVVVVVVCLLLIATQPPHSADLFSTTKCTHV